MKWEESDYPGISFREEKGAEKPYKLRYFVKKTAKSGTTRQRPIYRSFKTKRLRDQEASKLESERARKGTSSISLDPSMVKKWETAQAVLGPDIDPVEVAIEWKAAKESSSGNSRNPRVGEIVDKFIKSASNGKGADKIHHNTKMFDRLKDRYGNETFREFSSSTVDIERWINTLPFAQRTKINHYKQYKQVFAWAYRHRISSEDPFQRIEPPEKDEYNEVEYMSVEDVIKLFEANYDDADTCALLALNLFGGVRTSAVSRIEANELDYENRTLFTPAWKTKKNRSQLIEGHPDIMWLWVNRASNAAFAVPCKNVRSQAERKSWKNKTARKFNWTKFKALRNAGLAASTSTNKKKTASVSDTAFAPPHNWARHSFATYHCAAFRNYEETAILLSHAETVETLEKHYKGVATQDEGHRFFDVSPAFIRERLKQKG